MIPILYDGDEIRFQDNGLGRLADCTSCTVTEERNGIYECEFTLPLTSQMYPIVAEGMIVAVTHDDRGDVQPFDIYARTAPLDGLVTFYARHISYRLRNVILKPFTVGSCAAALAAMTTSSYNTNPFTFWTDKAVNGTFTVDVPTGCKAVLMGQEGSILDVYGTGEYEWDRWTVKLYTHRGNDNGVAIRYGVNLLDLKQDFDNSDSYSAVAPYWKSTEGGEVVTLPEGIIIAGSVPVKKYPWTIQTGEEMKTGAGEVLEFNVPQVVPVPMDLSADFEEKPTVAQLRQRATQRLNNSEAWLPSENLTVKFIDLAHTEDYKNVASLQRVSLCDTVSVYCGPVGVSAATMKVIKTVYNVLDEIYDEIEIGSPKTTFNDAIMAQVGELVNTATDGLASVAVMETAIENATEQITGAKGGHLLDIYDANGKRQEMVIMDTEDVGTAVKVWRFNLGGMGYSRNGYGGPYTLAITQDGSIVADFITTGTLTANVIKAGRLASVANTANFWDMVSGEFSLKSAGATTGIVYQNGTLTIDASSITTGTLSADRIGANTINVSKLTGSISKTSTGGTTPWVIDLANGTLTLGDINAANIKAGTISSTDGNTSWDLATGILENTYHYDYSDQGGPECHTRARMTGGQISFFHKDDDAGAQSYSRKGTIGATGVGVNLFDNRTNGCVTIEAGPTAGALDAIELDGHPNIQVIGSLQRSDIWISSERVGVGETNDIGAPYYGVDYDTFQTGDGRTVTVRKGIITSIS